MIALAPARPSGPDPESAGQQRRAVGWGLVPPVVAVVVSGIALRSTHQADIGSLGLIQAAPPIFFVGAAAAGAATAWQLTRPSPSRLLLLADVAALVLILYGFPTLAVAGPRVQSGFVSAGFVEVIGRTGHVLPHFDARFSWPGGFAWSALFEHTGSIGSQVELLRWAPVLLTSLYLLPLYEIVAVFTTEMRWRWATLVIFLLGDWVSQDYFAPQGISYLVYLCLIATVLRLLRGNDWIAIANRRPWTWVRRWTFGRSDGDPTSALCRWPVAVTLAMIAAIVVTHQLTPVIVVVALTALAWFGHTRTWALAITTGGLFLAYLSFGAFDYWRGHLSTLFGGLGRVGATAAANVGNRVAGNPGHVVVVDTRIAFVVTIFAAAGLGYLIRRLDRSPRRILALLMIAPFAILFAQSYGGEGLLRSYFFSLPFGSILVASLIPPVGIRRSSVATFATTCAVFGAIPLLLVTRYGNDAFDTSTSGEISAMAFVLATAPQGSPIAALNSHLPWEFTKLDQHLWEDLDSELSTNVAAAEARVEAQAGTWLVVTRSADQYGQLTEGRKPGWGVAFARDLLRSGMFRQVYRSVDAIVLVHTGPPMRYTPAAEIGGS